MTLLTLLAYALAPCPLILLARSSSDAFDTSKNAQHWAEFFCALLVSLVVGAPFVMVHVRSIELGAAFMNLAGFICVLLTGALSVWFGRADDSGGLGVSLFGN